MNTTIVYKAVLKFNNRILSMIVDLDHEFEPHALEYKIGEITKPLEGRFPMNVFDLI